MDKYSRGQPPVMYQPDPAGGHGLGYGQQPGRFGMAPSGAPPGGFGQQPMGFGMTPIGVPPGRFGQQPMGLGMTPIGVPPGLEYLTQIDQILIHQKVELLEAIIGFERNNKYDIKNTMGQKIYTANEETDCCTRNCIGSLRCFDMKIKDTMDREVIRLIRPLRCIGCCCPCCLQEMEVQSPPGTTIGFVKQDWHPCLPKFSIQGADGQTVMKLVGPCFTCSCCCGDVNFELRGKDGEESIGRISKQWSGLVKEFFTDAENFGIQFPMDLDVKMKAVLLGTCFLIDFMFFERN